MSQTEILIALFVVIQLLYFLAMLIDMYLFTLPVNTVDMDNGANVRDTDLPDIVLFYPVLNELEDTMRTTFAALARLDYPRDRYRVIAIPNDNDRTTSASLERLQADFPFVEILEVPPTSHSSWQVVWQSWQNNPHCYWWHKGTRAHARALPPKKTRQLIYAFYRTATEAKGRPFLVNYIDADSAPSPDHFRAGAIGMQQYDVLQATNIAGNLNTTLAASWHAFDHMTWDGRKYRHLSADGRHPYWVLGKGLFFRSQDLLELGGFHPWVTIEDPEVGMRFWKNGRRLGIIDTPLIEEVPSTFAHGITQRKRWVAGFFQSLGTPLKEMGFTTGERIRAWMNFLPCLTLWINAIGVPLGVAAIVAWVLGVNPLPTWTLWLAAINLTLLAIGLTLLYASVWRRSALVLPRKRDRLWYLIRCNPLALLVWWTMWLIPLFIGWRMYRRDEGQEWERTEKIDANSQLVRGRLAAPTPA